MRLTHSFEPVYDNACTILILGTFPSVQSRENYFYYGHPRNRFWPLLATLFGETPAQTIGEKKAFLLRHHIALWDVVQSCEITGSSDASIRNVIPNDIRRILETAPITHIFTNGRTAHTLYARWLQPQVGREAVCLPSTSPANAAWTMEKLEKAWGEQIIPQCT